MGQRIFDNSEKTLLGASVNSVIKITQDDKGSANTQFKYGELNLKKPLGKKSKYLISIIPSRAETKVEEITYCIDISETTNKNDEINLSLIIDDFIESSSLPTNGNVEFVKEIYSYGYKGNKSIFNKLVNLLLKNAVLDTRHGKKNQVKISFIEPAPKKFILTISSQGWGYKRNQILKIFETELRLVKEYCDQLNAQVTIENQYLNGTTLTITLASIS